MIQTRDASSMITSFSITAFLASFSWCLLGYLTNDKGVTVSNGIGCMFCAVQIILILYYGQRESSLPIHLMDDLEDFDNV